MVASAVARPQCMKRLAKMYTLVTEKWALYVLIGPALLLLLALGIPPLLYALYLSLHNVRLATMNSAWSFSGLRNYARIVTDSRIIGSVVTSLEFTVCTVGGSFILGLILALLLFQKGLRGRTFFRTALLVPLMSTPVVVGLAWRFILDPDLGLIGFLLRRLGLEAHAWLASPRTALPVVVLVDMWQWTPLVTLILLGGLHALPEEPFEAAQVDGASGWQTVKLITLPLLSTAMTLALVIRTMDALRVFDTVFVLTKGGPGRATEVLSIGLYLTGIQYFEYSQASALGIVILVVITLISKAYFTLLERSH